MREEKYNQTYIHNITRVFDFSFNAVPPNLVLHELLDVWLMLSELVLSVPMFTAYDFYQPLSTG
jgi:hypothetical protein